MPDRVWGKFTYPFPYINVIMEDRTYFMLAYGEPGCQNVANLDSLHILSKTLPFGDNRLKYNEMKYIYILTDL